jgi:hypothetical protein
VDDWADALNLPTTTTTTIEGESLQDDWAAAAIMITTTSTTTEGAIMMEVL